LTSGEGAAGGALFGACAGPQPLKARSSSPAQSL
jgi:hypothetical protein